MGGLRACTHYSVRGTFAGQKRVLGPLKRAIERVVSDRVESGRKSTLQSVSTHHSHLSSPRSFILGEGFGWSIGLLETGSCAIAASCLPSAG